jgi:hypothetical protein
LGVLVIEMGRLSRHARGTQIGHNERGRLESRQLVIFPLFFNTHCSSPSLTVKMGVLSLLLTALHLTTAFAWEVPLQGSPAPAGCKVMPGDSNWPALDVWTRELPGVVETGPKDANSTRPDYEFAAMTPADVQTAIKFATKYNVRFVIINSGSDFLGRSVI